MIKIENLSAETTLDAAALDHIHGGGHHTTRVWGDPHENLRDRCTSDADPSTMFIDIGAWAKA
jgi:hypothetical protein